MGGVSRSFFCLELFSDITAIRYLYGHEAVPENAINPNTRGAFAMGFGPA